MSRDMDELQQLVNDLVEVGMDHNDAIRQVATSNTDVGWRMLIRKMTKRYEQDAKNDARRIGGHRQLSFDFPEINGLPPVSVSIPNRKVYYTLDDGTVIIKTAALSTGEERQKSRYQAMDECKRQLANLESECRNEDELQSEGLKRGIDLTSKPFAPESHKFLGTKCWRCGLGYIEGDPFELGHSDKPFKDGGVKVEWEHRSCNRSAQDNPVTYVQPISANNAQDDAQ